MKTQDEQRELFAPDEPQAVTPDDPRLQVVYDAQEAATGRPLTAEEKAWIAGKVRLD